MLGKGRRDVYLPGCGLHSPLHSIWIAIELVFVLTVVVRQLPDIMQTLWSLQQKAGCFCLSNIICWVHSCKSNREKRSCLNL